MCIHLELSVVDNLSGGPHPSQLIFREVFEAGRARIAADELSRRLAEMLCVPDVRVREHFDMTPEDWQKYYASYRALVGYCERIELIYGEPCTFVLRS